MQLSLLLKDPKDGELNLGKTIEKTKLKVTGCMPPDDKLLDDSVI